MQTKITQIIALALLASPLAAYSDSSYEHTSQITGGQLVNMIKNFGMFSKQIRSMTDPTTETTMVHGNQKAVVSKDYTEITDLDKQVIIHIDNTKKNYSVMTFADMRKMIQEMPAKMAQMQDQLKDAQAKAAHQQEQAPAAPSNLQYTFTTDVKETGLIKTIESYSAKQQIMTMKTIVTDTTNPGTNITYSFTDEIWTTRDVPAEMKDVEEFDKRFGEKLMQGTDPKALMAGMANMGNGSQMAMMQLFGSKPGASDAFEHMQKEMAKIKGTRLVEITRMGGSGTGIDAGTGGASGQAASDTSTNSNSSPLSFPGSNLGGAFINAFHKKKPQPAAPAPDATTPAAGSAPAGPAPTDVTLMEMTAQTRNFSTDPVSTSVFQVPTGYKQVPSPMQQMMDK